jgi:glutamate N-acetyltransferase/amino-acid N-acetyltransferase
MSENKATDGGPSISPLAPKDGFPDLPTIEGATFASAAAGVKYRDRNDVMLAHLCEGTAIAGVFTRSSTRSAPVLDCERKLASAVSNKGPAAILVNSGNSNAFTGGQGFRSVDEICEAVAAQTGVLVDRIFTASTGVIGEPLPHDRIISVLGALSENLSDSELPSAAKAIMTTDTFAKGASAVAETSEGPVKIVGIAKGSGMIAPDMATMLAYIFTDARIEQALLQATVSELNQGTFNAITVDGDTSTSDTLLVAATQKSGAMIVRGSDDYQSFCTALHKVMLDLAHQVVKDGEGATKFVEISVVGAENDADARKVAASIANSPLVKTAIAGEDPNWGRVVMAVGKSGAVADRDRLTIRFGDILVAENGWVSPEYSEQSAADYMKGEALVISVDLGLGAGAFTMWTCDFTHQYISINADYRS